MKILAVLLGLVLVANSYGEVMYRLRNIPTRQNGYKLAGSITLEQPSSIEIQLEDISDWRVHIFNGLNGGGDSFILTPFNSSIEAFPTSITADTGNLAIQDGELRIANSSDYISWSITAGTSVYESSKWSEYSNNRNHITVGLILDREPIVLNQADWSSGKLKNRIGTPITMVPEPSSLVLTIVGVLSLGLRRRKYERKPIIL